MPHVKINGRGLEAPEGTSVLHAAQSLGIRIPTLCHDERLHPTGACRLCAVMIRGWERPVTACNTQVTEGMEIETHPPEIEELRKTLLGLLAEGYPGEAISAMPDKPLHALFRHYEVIPPAAQAPPGRHPPVDNSLPYLRVKMDQCIDCFRCVRICDEVQGQFVWRTWNRGAMTAIRPDSGTTLRESSCVSCGACADTCPSGAIEDRSVLEAGGPAQWTRTTCPYCGVGCEMEVGTRNGRIVQVKPALDAPVNKGHLCVKGRYAFEFTHAPDRVTRPMIRTQAGWQPVSWEEALGFVASRLKRILAENGPDSVGVLGSARGTNEENYLAQKFARVVLGTNNVDCCARVCHAPTAVAMKTMLGTGAATNSFDDIERSAGFLLCGTNATENHPVVGARIKQAVLRGAPLIVIDPRQIELARYATIHLALRPGTNVLLLNSLAHVLVSENLVDAEAVRDRISGCDEFRAWIGAFSPEQVADRCGVDPLKIRQAARLYASCRPAMCFHGLGMTEHTQGTEGVMCLVNLALLTGNIGKPGGGVNPLRGQNNVQGAAHMGCEPGHLPGFVPLEQGRVEFESAWRSRIPARPGLNLMQMVEAARAGSLKALWAIGYDVMLTNPETGGTRESLRDLELVIVQDLFLNEVARECGSVFLPAASAFEREGTFMNSERRVQKIRAAMAPPGEARPDWKIICDLAEVLGHGEQFAFASASEIWNEIRGVWKAGAGITWDRLDRGGIQWPCPSEDHPGTTLLHAESFPHGPRAALQAIPFRPSHEVPTPEFPFLLTTGRTLYQFNAGTMTMRTPNAQLRPTDLLDVSPADAGRLGLQNGQRVRLRSRHGKVELPVRIDASVKPGELFSTFHTPDVFLNRLTGSDRDAMSDTPEYKIVAVQIEKG